MEKQKELYYSVVRARKKMKYIETCFPLFYIYMVLDINKFNYI